MQWFYDGQIRRYVGQVIRTLSGFKYQAADGKQTTVPVMYGDMSRQVGNIIKENSENKLPSAPRIAVYISDLQLDRTRLADSTHVSKVHIRERAKIYDGNGNVTGYEPTQGSGYTVERLMPTPYKLTVKVDIWSTNTDQKLQIMEQILMLFNPSLELQTTDNYIDWTSISVLDLTNINFSSRQIPQGIDSDIDIASLTLESPIFISPPTKVKRLGVIQDIVMNIHDESYSLDVTEKINIGGFDIFVYSNKDTPNIFYAELLDPKDIIAALTDDAAAAWAKTGTNINWRILLDQYAGKFRAGSSQIFLTQSNGNEIVGTLALHALDETKLVIIFDQDTYNTNSLIENLLTGTTKGTIEAIINPETYNPSTPPTGARYLLLNDIGGGFKDTFITESKIQRISTGIEFTRVKNCRVFVDGAEVSVESPIERNGQYVIALSVFTPIGSTVTYVLNLNEDGASAWKNSDGSNFIAKANDIIEWDGFNWTVAQAAAEIDQILYITNLRTGVQYKYEDGEWTRAFEGEYQKGSWRIVL